MFGLPDVVEIPVDTFTFTTCAGSMRQPQLHEGGERASTVEDAHGVTVTGRCAYASTVEKDGRLR